MNRIYTDGTDWYIAADVDELRGEYEAMNGEEIEDLDEWSEAHGMLDVGQEDEDAARNQIAELLARGADDARVALLSVCRASSFGAPHGTSWGVRAPVREWGRLAAGFLCSTEF